MSVASLTRLSESLGTRLIKREVHPLFITHPKNQWPTVLAGKKRLHFSFPFLIPDRRQKQPKSELYFTVLHAHLLDTRWSSYNSRTEHDTEMKLTQIHFSRRVAEGFRSSWLQTLGNQLIDRSLYIRYTDHKYYLLFSSCGDSTTDCGQCSLDQEASRAV